MEAPKYIFCVNNPSDTEKYINYYYTDRGFIDLNSKIPTSNPPSLNEEIAESLITALRRPQNKAKDSFCSKKEDGVSEEYIIDEFIGKRDSSGFRNILINTIIYFDTNNKPFAFLMYKKYPHDANSIYISILCINSLDPKSEFSTRISGNQIVNNFKVACESVGIHDIYLESIPSAENFWKREGFKMVDPQPVYIKSRRKSSSSSSKSSSKSSSSSSRKGSKSSSSSSGTSSSGTSSSGTSSSGTSSSGTSSSRTSSSDDVPDKLFYFNIISTGSKGTGKKGKRKSKRRSRRRSTRSKRNNKTLKFKEGS
jgi:hypothetical protein